MAERTALIDQLKAFKKQVWADKIAELKSQFNFEYEKGFEKSHSTYLKNIFLKVDLDNLHFFKHQGLASVRVDNGIYVSEYAVEIEKNWCNWCSTFPVSLRFWTNPIYQNLFSLKMNLPTYGNWNLIMESYHSKTY